MPYFFVVSKLASECSNNDLLKILVLYVVFVSKSSITFMKPFTIRQQFAFWFKARKWMRNNDCLWWPKRREYLINFYCQLNLKMLTDSHNSIDSQTSLTSLINDQENNGRVTSCIAHILAPGARRCAVTLIIRAIYLNAMFRGVGVGRRAKLKRREPRDGTRFNGCCTPSGSQCQKCMQEYLCFTAIVSLIVGDCWKHTSGCQCPYGSPAVVISSIFHIYLNW